MAWLLAAAGPVLFAGINVWTRLHDDPGLARAGRTWEVVTWEASSAIATLALLWLADRAAAIVRRRPVRASGALAVLSLAMLFVVLHVATFVAIRASVYRLAGSAYAFGGWPAWAYETPKDLVTFGILVGVFVAARAVRAGRTEAPAAPHPPAEDIVVRESGRIHRLRAGEVLAVSAAGNYVELKLADGRALLWRNSLSDVERLLGPMGFVRTHRSWLVNRAHVRSVRPVGSGDREVLLADALAVPLSRRFAHALPQLTG